MLKRATLVLVVALSVFVLPSCSANPKPDLSALPASAQREYTLDQVVKIVNDSTTGAIVANHAKLLSDAGEKEILTINKVVLDILSANPPPSNWKELALAAVQKRRVLLPLGVNDVIDSYLATTMAALKGVQ